MFCAAILPQWRWWRPKSLWEVSLPEVQLCYKQISCPLWRDNLLQMEAQQPALPAPAVPAALFSWLLLCLSTGMFFPQKTFLGNNSAFFNQVEIIHFALLPFSYKYLFHCSAFRFLTSRRWWILKILMLCREVIFEAVCKILLNLLRILGAKIFFSGNDLCDLKEPFLSLPL